jgi:hypothetical protein
VQLYSIVSLSHYNEVGEINLMNMEAYIEVKPQPNFSLLADGFRSLVISGDLGGVTLTPGIYKATDEVRIQEGDLILDAKGNENAIWIFELASKFSTVGGAGGSVVLVGNAQAKNVFWQMEEVASIGEGTSFKGNILSRMVDTEEIPFKSSKIKPRFKRSPATMGWPLYGQQL